MGAAILGLHVWCVLVPLVPCAGYSFLWVWCVLGAGVYALSSFKKKNAADFALH